MSVSVSVNRRRSSYESIDRPKSIAVYVIFHVERASSEIRDGMMQEGSRLMMYVELV